MLQRAASNAYSWWCASHIRTNQSKWLNNDLQEMEGRVQAMLKIIEEDADSFAKRAEMYYRRRPELVNFVEETYRAYRALAERFDHVSGELHKANNTLATAFPDVQFPMPDDDDDNPEDFLSDGSSSLKPPPRAPQISFHKPPPEIPSLPIKRSKSKKSPDESQPSTVSSQISEDKAKEAIDKLQKAILVLQTEKEFIKSSYEIGVAKYWEIEKTITEMQEEVCLLQDEFSASAVIEDDEARALMAATALKSCKDTLANLQEHQKRSMKETIVESERIKTAKEKLRDLKAECGQPDEIAISETMGTNAPSTTTEDEASVLQQETLDLEAICHKVKDHLEISSQTSVMDLAEKIDELVNKLINLEFTVSSHNAQLHSLRSETDNIHKHLRSLEERKVSFINGLTSPSDSLKQPEAELHKIKQPTSPSDSLKQPEAELHKIKQPEAEMHKIQSFEKQPIHTDFADACHGLGDNSEKLQSPKLENQVESVGSSPFQEDGLFHNMEPQKENEETHITKIHETKDNVEEKTSFCPKDLENQVQPEPVNQLGNGTVKSQEEEQEDEIREKDTPQLKNINHFGSDLEHEDANPNLLQLLSDGLEGKEKILLAEYTTILRSYKETKRKLLEVEKKNQEYFAETMLQVKQLKSANAMKDGEIRSLRQILSSLQKSSDSKQQNSELLGGLDLEGITKQDASSGVQDTASANVEDDLKLYHVEEPQATSPIEEKFRKDIDALLDENLEFWLRFSTSFHQIQRFQSEFQTIQADIKKLKDSKTREGGKSEPTPEDKKLGELKSELQVWVEQNAMLRRELEFRFSSLCNIQEEITEVSNTSPEAGSVQFTPYQAAKFQGEVLNMQQENNKVADELQAGLDHVKALQAEVETTLSTLSKINEKFELSASKNSHHSRHTSKNFSSKNKSVPLRSFLYGAKPKKPSIFS